jgi:UDP-N-acetylglucosamine 3-dehydrogenase
MDSQSEATPLKAAVIGVGAMGRNHARVYKELSGVDLVGVADLDPAQTERIGGQHGARAYTDYQAMLAEMEPAVVSVTVPTQVHCQVVLDALAAGCHVLVEKPITATCEEAHTIIEQAAALRRVLAVGHIERYNPAVVELKRRLDAGELGRIFQIHTRRLGPFPARVRDVGVVVDLAPHDLDIMRYLTGTEVRRLYAETEQEIHTAHEDLFSGMVRFEDGVLGVLDINWLTPAKIREIAVTGQRGMFVANLLMQDLYFYENGEVSETDWSAMSLLRGVSEGRVIRLKVQKREPLRAELEAFVAAARGEAADVVTGQDGVAALELALKLVQSGQEARVIDYTEIGMHRGD